MRRAFQGYFMGILAAAETGEQGTALDTDPATGSRCPMILHATLAEKSASMSHKGFFDFLLGLFSSHRQTFRKSRKNEPAQANWWPTSPGLL
jgi:hypothetical protein